MFTSFTTRLSLLPALTLSVGLAACTTTETDDDVPARDFGTDPADVGQETLPEAPAYPDYVGTEVGRSIPNFKFVGYANYMDPANAQALQYVEMSDFYNPTGDELWPADSPFGPNVPKPRALLLDVSAVWCGPCNYESEVVLHQLYDSVKPAGGHFLAVLVENSNGSAPASYSELENWAASYDVAYTLALDPTWQTKSLLDGGYPTNIIIRTSDMKIIEQVAGVPTNDPQDVSGQAFWAKFNSVANGTYQD
ncbi:MAG: hypothetical protein JRI68_22030 [Deltaproteobacteria bacterium]|nr:hypothetical protein [Deltaproteobacteria bacterium]